MSRRDIDPRFYVPELDDVDQEYQTEPQEGRIKQNLSLFTAAANGQLTVMQFLLDEAGVDPNQLGPDGTSPLCAAAMWGYDRCVKILLNGGADPNCRNAGTGWTPLHAAALQEHGSIIDTLLQHGADALAEDKDGRTPVDFASTSEAVWPYFDARGYSRSSKASLLAKGILQRVEDPEAEAHLREISAPPSTSAAAASSSPSAASATGRRGLIQQYSRPGSAYIFSGDQPRSSAVSSSATFSSSSSSSSSFARPPTNRPPSSASSPSASSSSSYVPSFASGPRTSVRRSSPSSSMGSSAAAGDVLAGEDPSSSSSVSSAASSSSSTGRRPSLGIYRGL